MAQRVNPPPSIPDDVYNPTDNPRVNALYGYLDKTVTIVGCGMGGEIALHFLRSGIKNINLIDFDTLDAGNLVRHPCGAKHIGKNKAKAVRDLLVEYSPACRNGIKAYKWNILDNRAKFESIISQSDAVVIATDTDSSRFLANEVCIETKTPAIYVAMFQKGAGGELFTYIPGGVCYSCLALHQDRHDYVREYVDAENKADCSSKRDVRSMPGLGIDQSFLAAMAARKTLDILLEGQEHSLAPMGKNWINTSLSGIKALESTLSSHQFDLPQHVGCMFCNHA